MKKIFTMLLILLVLLALAACSGSGEQTIANQDDSTQNQVQNEEAVDYYAVILSLAGIWDWPDGGGNPIYIYDDGAWRHSSGDVDLYGNISITKSDGNFSLVFIVTHAEGPGAYGSPGIPPGYGVRYGDIWWDAVMYSLATDELRFEIWDGSMMLMERK